MKQLTRAEKPRNRKQSQAFTEKKYIEKHDKGENLNIGYIPL